MKPDKIIIEKLNQYFAFLLSILTTILIIILLNGVKNELNIEVIRQNFNIDIGLFVPEKSEKLQYMIGTIIFPISYFIYHLILRKVMYYENASKLYNITINSGFIGVTLLAFIINLNEPFYINCFKYTTNPVVSIIISAFILYIIVTAICIYNSWNNDKRIIDKMLLILTVLFIVWVSKLFVTNTYYYNNLYVSYHFDAYFYPVYKVFCGQTPLIDFNNIYGFYPYLLVPFFKLTGGLGMLRFSFVMAGLVFISLLSLAITINIAVKNKVLAFLGNLALDFVIIVYIMVYQGGEYYLQYIPHRILFPMLITCICVLILKAKYYKLFSILKIVGYLICTLSLLWNIDTGIVVIVAYCAFNIYQLLIKYDLSTKKLWIKISKELLFIVSTVISAIMIIILITYIRSGEIVNISDILYAQTSFYGLGYMMLRLPTIHPWILLILVYAVAMVKAIRYIKIFRSEESNLSELRLSLYFILSIIGMGIFVYFQGRSHLLTFIPVMWPGILLLILFAQEYLDKLMGSEIIENKKNKIITVLKTGAILLLIGSYAFALIFTMVVPSRIPNAKNNNKVVESSEITPILNEVNVIKVGDENIDIIAFNSEAIYCVLRETDIPNIPASVDMFTKEDYKKVIDYLTKTNNKVIFDRATYNLLITYESDQMQQVLQRFSVIHDNADSYISFQIIK